MKKLKTCLAGLFAAVLLFSVTGCSGDTTWVFETEKGTVPAGVYISYLQDAYTDAQNELGSTENIWDQTIDDISVEQWIINRAIERTKQYIAVDVMFDELGLTLGTEGQNTIKNKADTYWEQYQTSCEENGISYSSVEKLAESDYKTQKVFEYYYETDGVEAVNEETIKEYFYDNYAKVKYISISRYDLETGEEKDDEAIQDLIDEYVTQLNKGEDIDTLIDSYYAEVYEGYGLGDYEVDTSDSSRNVSLLSRNQAGDIQGFAEKTFEQSEFNVPYSDIGESYGYVGCRYDLRADDELYQKNRSAVLYQLKSDPFVQKLDERVSTIDITTNEEAINRYSPKNLK